MGEEGNNIQRAVKRGRNIRVRKIMKPTGEVISFADSAWPDILRPQKAPEKKPQNCVVTGLPARYVDPKYGLPYHNLEAFKKIRETPQLYCNGSTVHM